jgi:hypothetical protein
MNPLQTTGASLHKNSMYTIKYAITFHFDYGGDFFSSATSGL